ncbi:hypothetical protein T492DRAFT_304107 [Pavlovales sp. CCMP2436]|nr:hypothetical protein T492DRAFT_304107 [Pavlovales sp. CCMP2436]
MLYLLRFPGLPHAGPVEPVSNGELCAPPPSCLRTLRPKSEERTRAQGGTVSSGQWRREGRVRAARERSSLAAPAGPVCAHRPTRTLKNLLAERAALLRTSGDVRVRQDAATIGGRGQPALGLVRTRRRHPAADDRGPDRRRGCLGLGARVGGRALNDVRAAAGHAPRPGVRGVRR